MGHVVNSNRQFFHGPGISNTDMGFVERSRHDQGEMGFEVLA